MTDPHTTTDEHPDRPYDAGPWPHPEHDPRWPMVDHLDYDRGRTIPDYADDRIYEVEPFEEDPR